jgi:uncharacterized protein HemX
MTRKQEVRRLLTLGAAMVLAAVGLGLALSRGSWQQVKLQETTNERLREQMEEAEQEDADIRSRGDRFSGIAGTEELSRRHEKVPEGEVLLDAPVRPRD